MLISPAYAQAGGDPTGGLMSLLPLVLIFVVFYFILIRPQQKKAKDHRAMLADIKRGERIVTGGGIIATVIRVAPDNDEVIVEIAKDTRVKIVKGTIQTVLRDPAEATAQDNKPQEGKSPEGKTQEGKRRGKGDAKPAPEAGPGAGPEAGPEAGHASEAAPEPGEDSGPASAPEETAAEGRPANDPEPPKQG